jgi:hypothetical protein
LYCVIRDFVLDESDNIYAIVFFDIPGEQTINGKTYYAGYNLVKINPQSEIIWTKKLDNRAETAYSSTYTHYIGYKNGNLYVLGTYIGFLDLENQYHFVSQEYYQCFMWEYRSGSDYFIAKYDTTGVLQNAASFGEDYPDELIGMTIDDNENIYFAGWSDQFPCVASYSHITKLDSNLNVQWVDTLTRDMDWDSPAYVPMNIHFSNNGNLYVWNNALANILDTLTNGMIGIDTTPSPYLIEVNPIDGTILRNLSININSFETSYANTKSRYVNGYIDDFGNNLIVHTAKSTVVEDTQGYYDYAYQNLILYRINLTDFSANTIQEFNAIPNNEQYAMPGSIIVEEPFIYLSGNLGENPLDIYGTSIRTTAPFLNAGCTDVFYCKIDMSTYLNNSGIEENYLANNFITVFPNPVSEKLFVKSNSKIHTIEVFSINGTKIISSTYNNFCDISMLPNGMYFVQIYSDNSIKSAKFIVNH